MIIARIFDWWWLRGICFGRFDQNYWVGLYTPSLTLAKYNERDFKGWILLQTEYEYETLSKSFEDLRGAMDNLVAVLTEVSRIDRLLIWISSWFDKDKEIV